MATHAITTEEAAALAALCQTPGVFNGTSPALLEHLLPRCELRRLAPDELLLEPEVPNQRFYVVVSGSVRVHLRGLSEPALSWLGPGECAGEVSLLDRQEPSAYVVADEPTLVLGVTEQGLWELTEASRQIPMNLLRLMARRLRFNTAVIADSVDASRRAARAAMTDGLTGIPNRRWLDETFPRELQRCREARRTACLMMIDADHFKTYNDTHGHQAGDRALQRIARTLQQRLRPHDLLARYGGEEFALMLPDTDLAQARHIAERIRSLVGAATVSATEAGQAITVSIGLAEWARGEDLGALMRRADEMLYEAKRSGRDRVCVSSAAKE